MRHRGLLKTAAPRRTDDADNCYPIIICATTVLALEMLTYRIVVPPIAMSNRIVYKRYPR